MRLGAGTRCRTWSLTASQCLHVRLALCDELACFAKHEQVHVTVSSSPFTVTVWVVGDVDDIRKSLKFPTIDRAEAILVAREAQDSVKILVTRRLVTALKLGLNGALDMK